MVEKFSMLLNTNDRLLILVLKINCRDCDKIYIGETKGHLETRTKGYLEIEKCRSK